MSATPEHKGEMAVLAARLTAAGQPKWAERINVADVFHNDDLTLTEKRDVIVARIKASRWYRSQDDDSELHDAVYRLSVDRDADEFDYTWDEIYDLADYARVWIGTF